MIDYDDFIAFLHIIHVSDIHYRASPSTLKSESLLRTLARRLRQVDPDLATIVDEQLDLGFAGHDPSADKRMREFLNWFIKDPEFGSIPAWLLDTGDLSAVGDTHSISAGIALLKRYQSILAGNSQGPANKPLGVNAKLFSLYGNHDAWPETFPLWCRTRELEAHRTALRSGFFPPHWPHGPLEIDIPYRKSRLALHGVNSAIDDRWHNAWARGRVSVDPHWPASIQGVDQLKSLADSVARKFHTDGHTRDFRILAVHHPIHFPPPRPARTMHLENDDAVAKALLDFERLGRGKLAQLIVSGHTHCTFPASGELESSVMAGHAPLASGQLQLVTGSLAKVPSPAASEPVPHQFQILTFYASPPHTPAQLVIERRVVGRVGGVGEFDFLVLGSGGTEEAALLDY